MSDTVDVATTAGVVRGQQVAAGLAVFRGIPFAAPPVGDLRFRPPAPVEPWSTTREALTFGPIAVQPVGGIQGALSAAFGAAEGATSEDCLTLNVWTPGTDGAARPVMVWIHGGAFRMGSGSSPIYDGTTLATRGDVVVVTFNYRLGVLGFLASPELETANCGLLDQVAALEWVRDNIAAFGGDPGQVTVFGESAGAKSVECLLSMPSARGLFGRAILQSTYDTSMDLAQAAERARSIAAELGAVDDLEALRRAPLDELLAAEQRVAVAAGPPSIGAGGSGPVVDGSTLPVAPIDAVRAGVAADIPLVIGTTLDEARLFAAMAQTAPAPTTDAAAGERLVSLIGAPDDAAVTAEAIDAYRAGRAEWGREATPGDLVTDAMTDRMFRQHSIRLAEAASVRPAPAYMYLLTWESPVMGGRLGACHAIDLPFVFGTMPAMAVFVGDGPEADALATRMQDAWLAFATGGAPAAVTLPPWPRFDTERRATMVLGPECRVADAPLEPIRTLWSDHSTVFAPAVSVSDR